MPTLNWIGKDKVVNYHLKVPYHVLERKYSFDEEGQHEEDNGSENMIIHGDNLLALKSLLPKYEGKNQMHLHRAKMLEIDTILRTVCIVEKSIYSGGLANVGRMPAFFML